MTPLSPNGTAILLLTAPLVVGRVETSPDLLSATEYRQLAQHLRAIGREPADLLRSDDDALFRACDAVIEEGRLRRLLARGFVSSQAVQQWQTRAIWVVSRADAGYPRRLKTTLRDEAPAVLYGCGEAALIDTGAVAVAFEIEAQDILDGGGVACLVLANALDRAALHRAHRRPLMSGRLVLVSAADPSAPAQAGHAAERDRLIDALKA